MSNENIIARKGVQLTLRDSRVYTVLPLTLNELIKILPIIQKLESGGKTLDAALLEDIKKLVKVALAGQATGDTDVGDLVDMQDIQKIIAAIMGQNEDDIKAMLQSNI
jgi:hypothetical protein